MPKSLSTKQRVPKPKRQRRGWLKDQYGLTPLGMAVIVVLASLVVGGIAAAIFIPLSVSSDDSFVKSCHSIGAEPATQIKGNNYFCVMPDGTVVQPKTENE